MLALYKKSEQFVCSEVKMFGKDAAQIAKSKRARIDHFVRSLPSMEQDIEDSDQAMAALQEESDIFSQDDRRELALAISSHMSSKVSGPTSTNEGKLQNNKYLYNYLPSTIWSKFMDESIQWDTKLEIGIDFFFKIKLWHPKDETYKMLLAIVSACHKRILSADDAYNGINQLRTKMVNKRPLQTAPCEQSLLEYPEDSADFTKQFRDCYSECDMPVASKLDAYTLRDMVRRDRMPTRSTSNSLKSSGKNPTHSPTSNSSDAMDVMRMCMGFMAGNQPLHPELLGGGPKVPPKKAPLPIEDKVDDSTIADVGPGKVTGAEVATPPTGVAMSAEAALSAARDVLAKRKATKSSSMKKKKGEPKKKARPVVAEESSESEAGSEMEEACATGDESPIGAIVLRKPSASTLIMKKPSTVDKGAKKVLKRPAAMVTEKPAPTTNPARYMQGKIYYDKIRRKLRVYRRKGDKHELAKTVDHTDGIKWAEAWAWALEEIVKDPRP